MTELITPYEEIVLEEGLAKGRVEGRVEEGWLKALTLGQTAGVRNTSARETPANR
jgi:hypothetical protein